MSKETRERRETTTLQRVVVIAEVISRLRVVPHFSSGKEELAKREHA